MHNLAIIAGRNMSHHRALMRRKLFLHGVVIMSWDVMHLLLHVVIIVSVIASRGISRIYKNIMLHWFTRNVVTCLVSLRRLLDRRDNILEHFVFD